MIRSGKHHLITRRVPAPGSASSRLVVFGFLSLLLLVSLGVTAAASVPARNPAQVLETAPGPNGGPVEGTSITAAGRWAFVINSPACRVFVYELDFASMEYLYRQRIDAPRSGTCSTGRFGAVASASGEVLIVGAPNTQRRPGGSTRRNGAFYMYALGDDGVWAAKIPQSSLLGRRFPPQNQRNQNFGFALSISRISADDDRYLVVAGAPNHDPSPGGNQLTNAGQISVFDYDVSDDINGAADPNGALRLIGVVDGDTENENLGFAVTVSSPFVLAGAPGYDDDPSDALVPGRLLVVNSDDFDLNGDLAPGQRTFLSASDTEQLGQEVSLSSKVLLGASLTNGRAWAITGPENNRSYTLTSDLFRNEGGDVSGSQPAALGVVPFGGSIFRDPLTDVIGTNVANPGDGIVVDISLDPDVPTGDNSDLGIDIRLTREALWFANAAASRAIYYQFPCGFGTRLRSDPPQYQLLSVPCDLPANTTYGELFPDIGDTTKIRIYRFDETFGSPDRSFIEMRDGSAVLTPEHARYGFFMISAEDRYFAIPGTDQLSALPTFTASEPIPTDFAVPLDWPVRRVFKTPLKTGSFSPDADKRLVIAANRFPRAFDFADLTVTETPAGGVPDTRSIADSNFVEPSGWVYDPQPGVANPYVAVSGTPGMDRTRIRPYEAFYVRLTESGVDGTAATVILNIPQVE